MTTDELRAGCRKAYEQSRVGLGLRAAWPVVPMVALALYVGDRPRHTLLVGALLALAAASLRWRGETYARALTPGFLAGSAPLLLPLLFRATSHCCIGSICMSSCMLGCVGGGVIAGVAVGLAAALEQRSRGPFLLSASLIAGLAGMLGCAVVGVSGVIGMAVALAITSLPVTLAARHNP
jgi:hypothetical protein